MQNKDWERWNLRVREGLIEMQVKDDTCATRKLGPIASQPRPLGRTCRPALRDVALDPDPGSLLPLSAPLSNRRLRRARSRRRSRTGQQEEMMDLAFPMASFAVREDRSKTQADAASSTSAHSRGQARDASLFVESGYRASPRRRTASCWRLWHPFRNRQRSR